MQERNYFTRLEGDCLGLARDGRDVRNDGAILFFKPRYTDLPELLLEDTG